MAKGESPTRDAALIGKEDLIRLVKSVKSARGRAEEAAGEVGSLISKAVEKKNLHKGAFRQIMSCMRMDPVKLHSWKANFDKYWDDLGLEDQIAAQLPVDENVDPGKRGAGKAGSQKRKGGEDDGDGEDGAEGSGGSPTSLAEARATRRAAGAAKD